MVLEDIKRKTIRASAWSAADVVARQGLRFIVTMILARLLTPSDFGVIGMLAIFVSLSLAFVESGFPHALIQRAHISEIDLCSVFYFNIFMGLLCGVVLCFAAPYIATFFQMSVLEPLIWIVAANLLIGSFGSVQNTLLIKELNFRKVTIISIVSTVISGFVALVLAWQGFGVWSLAIQVVVATSVSTILLWTRSAWRPSLSFSLESIQSLFKYSSFILFTVLADAVYTRLHTVVIGKGYSASDLGYFIRADQTQQLPGGIISGIIGRVAFPAFAAVQEDDVLLKAGLKKAISTAMFISIPVMFGLVVTSESLVPLLFGDQWGPAIPYLKILSLGGVFIPFDILNMNVLAAQGHSNLVFRITLIKKGLGIAFVCIASFFSITVIAWSVALAGLVSFFVNAHYTGILLNYGAFRQLHDIFPYLVGSVVMALCVQSVTYFEISTPFGLVLLQIVTGAFVYGLFCHLFRLSSFIEMLKLIATSLRKIKGVGKKGT